MSNIALYDISGRMSCSIGELKVSIHEDVWPQFCNWEMMGEKLEIFSRNFSNIVEFTNPIGSRWGFARCFREIPTEIPGYRSWGATIYPPVGEDDDMDPDYLSLEQALYSLGIFFDFCSSQEVVYPEKGIPRYFEVDMLMPHTNPVFKVCSDMYPWLQAVEQGINLNMVSEGIDRALSFILGRPYDGFSAVDVNEGRLWLQFGNCSMGISTEGFKGLKGDSLKLFSEDAECSHNQFAFLVGIIVASVEAHEYNQKHK